MSVQIAPLQGPLPTTSKTLNIADINGEIIDLAQKDRLIVDKYHAKWDKYTNLYNFNQIYSTQLGTILGRDL